MLPNPGKFCSRCENEVTIGGYCIVPGKEETPWFCLECAVEYMKENTKTEIKNIKLGQIKKKEHGEGNN